MTNVVAMSKKLTNTDQKIERNPAVTYDEWINQRTGEVRQFAIVEKPIYMDTNFYKVFLVDLLSLWKEMGRGRIKVLFHILENIEPSNNMFIGTYDRIAKDTNSARKTIAKTLKFLQEIDFLRLVQPGVYMVSPRYIVKGSHKKRQGLMIKYQDIPHTEEFSKRQLDMFNGAE